MKHIVVGLEPNAESEPVIDWIERYAADVGAHVVIVHVVPETTLWMISGVQASSTAYIKTLRGHFEEHVRRRLRDKGISAEIRIERGDPVRQLVAVARHVDADLIVVGGSEHSTFHDAILGNAVRKLEHCADIPILVVPPVARSHHG